MPTTLTKMGRDASHPYLKWLSHGQLVTKFTKPRWGGRLINEVINELHCEILKWGRHGERKGGREEKRKKEREGEKKERINNNLCPAGVVVHEFLNVQVNIQWSQ